MDLNELLQGVSPGNYLQIFLNGDDGEFGKLQRIDWQRKVLVLLRDEDGAEEAIDFDQIEAVEVVDEEGEEISTVSAVEEQLKSISPGAYIAILKKNDEGVEGELQRSDWEGKALILRDEGTDQTIKFDEVDELEVFEEEAKETL